MKFPWSTPSGDGEILISPEISELSDCFFADNNSMPDDTPIGETTAGQLRRQTRQWLGSHSNIDADKAIVATGHQCEFHHCGVWFKDAVTCALAEKFNAQPLHFAADLDAMHENTLAIPLVSNTGVTLKHIEFTPKTDGLSPAFIAPPSPETLELLNENICRAQLNSDSFTTWHAAIKPESSSKSLAHWITTGRNAVNKTLGLNLPTAYFSELCGSNGFLGFASSIILESFRFLEIHNSILSEHRKKYSYRNTTRPVPDLAIHEGEILETPFWIIRKNNPRAKLFTQIKANKIRLFADNESIACCNANSAELMHAMQDLFANGTLIAPRALTLTMFLRHFAVDIFVHGTGGARYDIAGDEVSRLFFGFRPNKYLAATATNRLPLPVSSSNAESLSRAKWQLHHWRHNPLSLDITQDTDAKKSIGNMLCQMGKLKRKSPQRRELFDGLVSLKKQLRLQRTSTEQELLGNIKKIASEIEENRIAQSREYFFAFFGQENLKDLIRKARAWSFGGGK